MKQKPKQREVEHVIDHLAEDLQGKDLLEMYASEDRNKFADTLIIPHIKREMKRRQKVEAITQEKMQYGLRLVLEEMSDAEFDLFS